MSLCFLSGGVILLELGDRAGAETLWHELSELADRTSDSSLAVLASSGPVRLAFLDGRIEECLALCESAEARSRELGVSRGHTIPHRLQSLLGQLTAELAVRLPAMARAGEAERALLFADLGRHEEARSIYERFADLGSPSDESALALLVCTLEAAILGHDQPTVRVLVPRLALLADQLCLSGHGPGFGGSVARLLGAASALLGQPDDARAYYQQAIKVCARVRFRPEIAITRLHLAEVLLEHYPEEQPEAQQHLDFAIEELRAMKMQPALERALRHKGLLKA